MIRYSKNSPWTVFYWWGGINRLVLKAALMYLVILCGIYYIQTHIIDCEQFTHNPAFHETVKGILSFLVFLLVFRLNQCMARHYAAYALITDLFYGLDRLTLDFCVHLNGDGGESYFNAATKATAIPAERGHHSEERHDTLPGEPPPSPWVCSCLAVAAKVNVIRLIIAYAVSMVLHFQLLDAASDSAGVLDEMEVKQVIFLYCRLRSLLHDEEMEIIDRSLSVVRDATPGFPVIYRTEVSRYRVSQDEYCDQLLGHCEADRGSGGVTIVPAPKVIMSMLVQALLRPSDQPWGYQSRMYNLFARITLKLVNDSMHLESIIMSPTPLPYLQHCRVLFLFFGVAFPVSMDTSEGFVPNVLLPLIIFWAIMGFEMLSGVLENPLGNDETDMNIFEKIHSLEVACEHIFNSTECHKAGLHHALIKTENLVLGERHDGRSDMIRSHRADPTKNFRSYFQWVPLPTVVLQYMMESHGEVESLHQLWLNFKTMLPDFSIRLMLRRSLYRRTGGRLYQQVGSQEGLDQVASPIPVVDFNKDPTYFCHCLQFVGAASVAPSADSATVGDGCMPQPAAACWRDRVVDLLEGHPAQKLLKVTDPGEDTERSLMLQTPRSGRPTGIMAFFEGWESLS